MLRIFLESASLLFASLVSFAVVYYKISQFVIQSAIAVMIVVLLVLTNHFIISRSKKLNYELSLAFFSLLATFLQLLVLFSGGFLSPFLISFHLFAIITGFFLNLRISIAFLSFAVITLLVNTLFDPKLYAMFTRDPWSVALYILSFVIIVPLYKLVASRYYLQGDISQLLSKKLDTTDKQLKLNKKAEESLLGSLYDIVVTTDTALHVLSINEAAARILKLTEAEIVGRPIFEVICLKDLGGRVITPESLSIETILNNPAVQVGNNLLLYPKDANWPKKIALKVSPVKDLNGNVRKMLFIISGFYGSTEDGAESYGIGQALSRHKALLSDLKGELEERRLYSLETKIELLGKIEKDILIFTEITEHQINPKINFKDVAPLARSLFLSEDVLAKGLGVKMEITGGQKFIEALQLFNPQQGEEFPTLVTSQYFSALVDPYWLEIVIEKLIDLSLYVSLAEKNPALALSVLCDDETVVVAVDCPYTKPIPEGFYQQLLMKDYGNLGQELNFQFGSGLEGLLIQTITTLLKIPFRIFYQEGNRSLRFEVRLSKRPGKVA